MNAKSMFAATLMTAAVCSTVNPAQAQSAILNTKVSTANLEKGYKVPHRKPIKNSDLTRFALKLRPYEKKLNTLGFTLANTRDLWTTTPVLDASYLAQQVVLNKAAGFATQQTQETVVYDTFNKSWASGDTSSMYVQTTFNMTHSASQTMARLQAEADVNGALFGYSANLAKATVDMYAPATGDQSASMGLTVMGQTVWSKNQTGATASVSDGFDWNGRLWQTGFDWSIAGYGVGAEIWLQGSVDAHFGGSCTPLDAEIGADAGAGIGVGGRAWANIGIVDASLDAKLTLASIDFSATASTTSTHIRFPFRGRYLEGAPIMVVNRKVQADLDLLSGYARVKVTDPIFGYTLGSWTLWNQPNGLYQWSGVLDNTSSFYFLP